VSAANEASALGGTFGSLTNIATGAALPATTQVMQVGAWIADKSVKKHQQRSELHLAHRLHKLTAATTSPPSRPRPLESGQQPAAAGDE